MHRETSKFKQLVLTLVSPVSSIGIKDDNIIQDVPEVAHHADFYQNTYMKKQPIYLFLVLLVFHPCLIKSET